jgi:hypothetical protein
MYLDPPEVAAEHPGSGRSIEVAAPSSGRVCSCKASVVAFLGIVVLIYHTFVGGCHAVCESFSPTALLREIVPTRMAAIHRKKAGKKDERNCATTQKTPAKATTKMKPTTKKGVKVQKFIHLRTLPRAL